MIKRTTTGIFILMLIGMLSISSFAAWINFEPQIVTQPDGTTISCFATGDEFYNWLHDENGFTIIQNHEDGYYYYAGLIDDQLVPSMIKVGESDPEVLGFSPWTNISPEKMNSYRVDFLKNKMPEKPQIPGYSSPKNTKNEGVLNNLVVYIRFSDQTEYTIDTMQYYNYFNNTSPNYNSMQNYFETVSYDMISIPSWFYPEPPTETVISYQDIYERSYFMPYDPVTNPNGYQSGQSGEREHALLKRACEFIEEEVPVDLIIDKDNDGYVDNMVYIIRGATTAWATLLWPHRWALYGEDVYINGKRVWDYNLQVEDHLNGSGPGVLCHEMFHSLSAPDLYHYTSAPYTSVGPWDLMDNANNPPESMGAYMKFRYGGWIEEIPEITECGTYTLNPLSESENNTFKIASPNTNNEYYVLEYRVKEGIFEGSIPGTGLIIYRIDNTLSGSGNAQGPPDEVYVYRPNGTINNNGDLWSAHYAADYNRTEINDNTNPSPFLQNGQAGGLIISNIGYIGETISFDVYFEKEPVAEFESSDTLITEGCSIDFYDLSVCEVYSWEWTFEGGTPSTSNEQFPNGIVYENEGFYTTMLTVTNQWGESEIIKTDVIHVCNISCPQVDFYATDTLVCTEEIIQLTDFSIVCPDTWLWEITPSTYGFVNGSNESTQNPEVIFMSSGAYSISLTVSNANGSTTLTKDDYISAGGTPFPFFDDFESGNAEQSGWTIINPDNDNTTWDMFTVAGNGGTKAAGINLFNYNSILKRDQLISPPIDLTGINNAILKFDHAYAIKDNPNYSDSLVVKISTDCGENWIPILQFADDGAGSFATHTPSTISFIPATVEDWCGSGYGSACFETNISQWAGQPNVMIMFESVRVAGNNMFIDNVSVNIQTDIDEVITSGSKKLNIYPNPSSGKINIESNEKFPQGKILLYNSHGVIVFESTINDGQRKLSYNLSGYPTGMYIIQIVGETFTATEKITIK